MILQADAAAAPAAAAEKIDTVTILRHSRNVLAKTWRADGSVVPYDDPKYFIRSDARVDGIAALSSLLTDLEADRHACVIRGRYVGDETARARDQADPAVQHAGFKRGMVRRALDYFDDQPLHAVMFDVDKFRPVADPVADPVAAINEYIRQHLPQAFHLASYHWQLSNTAGLAKNTGILKAHVWFWLSTPYSSAQLKAWALHHRLNVDVALFNPVQVHYTAAPAFEDGVADPVPLRSGLDAGMLTDDVDLRITAEELVAAPGSLSGGRGQRLQHVAEGDEIAQALAEAGLVKSQRRDGGLNIECPFADEHSGDSGETSTIYWPPHTGGHAVGNFKCMHSHCDGRPRAAFLARLGIIDGSTPTPDDFDVVELTPADLAESRAVEERNRQRAGRMAQAAILRAKFEPEKERSARIAREGSHQVPTQRIMSGTEMLEELVFLADGARVAYLHEPRAVLPFNEFKHFTAGSLDVVKGEKGRVTKVKRADVWLAHAYRKTVRCQTFAPGQGRICKSPDGDEALNLWMPRAEGVPENWRDLSKAFFGHVEYLVPNAAERARFLDWLAHIEQQPGVLPHTHYLLVAKQTGIGRNWLAYALARVFAGYVALGFDLGESLRSGFNGALSQRLLAVVDELHEGGPGGANSPAAEKLKSMLTEQTRRVNPKYGRQHVEFNCCRFLMFSNHEAALPLAENDRRVVVIENPSTRRPAEYYTHLYALLDDPGLGAAIAHALRQRDISSFNPGQVAPMSEAKAKTIRAGRSELEQAIRDLAADWPSECITSPALQAAVAEALGGRLGSLQGPCVVAGIVKYAKRVRVAGDPRHVWILRNFAHWQEAAPADVAAECMKGETHGFGAA